MNHPRQQESLKWHNDSMIIWQKFESTIRESVICLVCSVGVKITHCMTFRVLSNLNSWLYTMLNMLYHCATLIWIVSQLHGYTLWKISLLIFTHHSAEPHYQHKTKTIKLLGQQPIFTIPMDFWFFLNLLSCLPLLQIGTTFESLALGSCHNPPWSTAKHEVAESEQMNEQCFK